MLDYNARQTPLRRNVTIDEVGNAAAFLSSDLASGISGEILYVDGGFNTTAMGDLIQIKARGPVSLPGLPSSHTGGTDLECLSEQGCSDI